jgi:hypothetical protein
MQHISETLDKYKDLSLQQFNHIKANNITDFEMIGDLSDFDNDFLVYKNGKGEEIQVSTNGEVYNHNTGEIIE